MPFDGNTYGKVALIAPIEYHPDAVGAPGVVSKSLAGAYTYSRTSAARRIGDQTYQIYGRDPRVYATTAWSVDTTWIILTQFSSRYIPDHATHIVARVDFHVPGVSGISIINLRVVATSTATDTGIGNQLSVDLSNFTSYGLNNGLTLTAAQVEAEVELATITKDAQASISVQGYVVDDGGSNARAFGVAYVVAWWEARG